MRPRSRTTLAADMSVQIRRCNRDVKVPATDLEQLILLFRLLVSRATVMLDHLSLNVKVLFELIKMEFMVSGTAWFSVLSIYICFTFFQTLGTSPQILLLAYICWIIKRNCMLQCGWS